MVRNKYRALITQSITTLALLGLMLVGASRLARYIHAPRKFSIICDTALSATAREAIEKTIQECYKPAIAWRLTLGTMLTSTYACISHIETTRQRHRLCCVYIHANMPLACINNTFALYSDGRYASLKYYKPEAYARCHCITVNDWGEATAHTIAPQLQQCPAAILETYDIRIDAFNEWRLCNKTYKHIEIVWRPELLTANLLERYCDYSVRYILAQENSPTPKSSWIADLRFDEQIVIRPEPIHHAT